MTLHWSIAPSISGSYTVDIKKEFFCLLFRGSRKMLLDRMKLKGDINLLLLGGEFIWDMERLSKRIIFIHSDWSHLSMLN